MKEKEKSLLPDKKQAPKKTGKRLPPPEDKDDVQQEAIDKFLGGVKNKTALDGESAFKKTVTKQKPMGTALMADNPGNQP